ncbi:hypothetical protein KOR34_00860 [Posidoniimonas corsicana]|uniref:Uncharacterized protein n=1 Tax=Posidoniimonas corsicana TaxID=1938618 RepID=A0A5C5V9F8_9BACT|nr:hypothetical protein [Posidoniimonas corsicana]TWT35198.1 hypothetical protein KOR34_00860 [Posidoniimonas corsicana]
MGAAAGSRHTVLLVAHGAKVPDCGLYKELLGATCKVELQVLQDTEAADFPVVSPDQVSRSCERDLEMLGYRMLRSGQSSPRGAYAAVLEFAAAHDSVQHFWVLNYDVRFSGDWAHLFSAVADEVDFAAPMVVRRRDRPDWPYWDSVSAPSGDVAGTDFKLLAANCCAYRLSQRAVQLLRTSARTGWTGHEDALLPTILHSAGLLIEDLGGTGPFTPADRRGRFYSGATLGSESDFMPPTTDSSQDLMYYPVRPRPNSARSVDAGDQTMAILVMGPESSGTRLMTSLLIDAGCYGDATHRQRIDRTIPQSGPIVWRRSFPHGDGWPDAVAAIRRLQSSGYIAKAVVMTRDWHCVVQSQLERRHATDAETALARLQDSYRRIYQALCETNIFYINVSYESLILNGGAAVSQALANFGLSSAGATIGNGNEKHFRNGV